MIGLRDAEAVLSGLVIYVSEEGFYDADRPIDAALREEVATIKAELKNFEPQFEELGSMLGDLRTMVRLVIIGL
jgi:hypothetical protein